MSDIETCKERHAQAEKLHRAQAVLYSPNSGDTSTELVRLEGDASGWYTNVTLTAGEGYTEQYQGEKLVEIKSYNMDLIVNIRERNSPNMQQVYLDFCQLCDLVATFQAWEVLDSKLRPGYPGLRGKIKMRGVRHEVVNKIKVVKKKNKRPKNKKGAKRGKR